MDGLLLSICIPTCNRARMVYECIQELLKIDNDEFEIVVCDNASTDNTRELVSTIQSKKLTYYRNDENIKYLNLIKVMEYAKGENILLLSDEDYFISQDAFCSLINNLKTQPDAIVSFYSALAGDGNRFYLYHKDVKLNGINSFIYGGMHSVFSGMVIRRQCIDFEWIWNIIREMQEAGVTTLYPHVALVLYLYTKGNVYCRSQALVQQKFIKYKYNESYTTTASDPIEVAMFTVLKLNYSEQQTFYLIAHYLMEYYNSLMIRNKIDGESARVFYLEDFISKGKVLKLLLKNMPIIRKHIDPWKIVKYSKLRRIIFKRSLKNYRIVKRMYRTGRLESIYNAKPLFQRFQ